MLNDARLAARMLLQSKGWTVVVLASLALGIGANTALFSAVNGLLLRKLPVRDPDSLVRLRYVGPNQVRTDVLSYGFMAPDDRGRQVEPVFSYAMYRELVAANRTMSDVVAYAPFGRVNVVADSRAEIASADISSGNYFQALGVTALTGRTIAPEDDAATAAPVAVISHNYWMSRFGGSTGVVGMLVHVNNVPVTIVGVLPSGFTGIEQTVGDAADISVPLALEPQLNPGLTTPPSLVTRPTFWWLLLMGRLRPGVTAAQARGNLAGVFQEAARGGFETYLSSLSPEDRRRSSSQDHSQIPELLVDSGSHGIYDVRETDIRAVTVLTAVAALVLLIVCANVANLLLSRATVRQRELSVRLALGATRGRLARQLLTESLLLAAIGGVLGMLVGRWGQQLLPGAPGQSSPLDWRVLVFVIAVTTLTGVVFGTAPALRATRTDVSAALKDHNRSVAGSPRLFGSFLVVAQVAISLVLLVGAGLFLRTLQNLRHGDLGFNPRNVVLFQVSPALNRYETGKRNPLYDQIGERLRAIAGVRAVSWSNPALMAGRRFSGGMFIQGRPPAPGRRDTISGMTVSPTFFETMEIPVLAGRAFTARDAADAPRVVVINDAAARKYFPNEYPIGRHIGSSLEGSGQQEIVGVLRDAKYNSVRDAAVPTKYTPYLQSPQGSATFEVRTAGDPLAAIGGIREAVRQIDPTLPLIDMTTQSDQVERAFAQEKVFAQAYTLFGSLAVLVASVGLFGLMSHRVARRTNEIGIRMALGAARQDVVRLVMRDSMILVVLGVAIGLGAARVAGRLVANLLFGLAPTDWTTMAGAMTVILLVSSLAGYLPARQGSRVDPMVALRDE
ncbi:MAG TPA: ABC transporter permease [Vicinamibacterales bacterium]|jgi:predicted permease|nr:ABC transporter permease [Vicinamibacterales bacterium]